MDQQTIDTYNQMAREYDEKTVDFWNRFPRTFLDAFIALSGIRILDIGSGPGRDGLLLRQAGKDVVCLDASQSMIELSSQRGLTSVLGTFETLPFGDGSFDGVWSYTSLLHIPKSSISLALQEVHRTLTPSGVFALGLIEGDSEGYRDSSGISQSRWFSFYQKEETIDLVQTHGFSLIYFKSFKPCSKNYLNFLFQKTTN